MMRSFNLIIARIRYLFVLAVLALAVLALGSLARGVYQLGNLAIGGRFAIEPGGGALVVPYFIRAAFLYFLAVALGSLFVGDIPAPQWMTVKNLFQFRTKVLTFVSIILPLGFMGKMMASDSLTPGIFYSGAGVFLVLLGIFFLTRYRSPSGDEGMAREDNRVQESYVRGNKEQGVVRRGSRQAKRRPDKERGQSDRQNQDEWLEKQKEELKFQKETLEKAVDRDISSENAGRQGSNVTVKPGPRRPRGRRR